MYKRINELGLKVVEAFAYQTSITAETGQGTGVCSSTMYADHYVRASDLEALLEKGVEVRSYSAQTHWFPSTFITNTDSHTALLINIKPIEKPNPISIKELISDLKILQIDGLAERIEKWGIEQAGVSDE